MTFKNLKNQMQEAFVKMLKNQTALFITDTDKDLMWDTYLDSFEDPAERQGHTCNCCRQFIKNYGNVVAIKDGRLVTIWDFLPEPEFHKTIDSLMMLVKSSKIKDAFLADTQKLGTDKSIQLLEDKSTRTWEHFHLVLPKEFVNKSLLSIASVIGTKRDNRNVFKRSLDEISIDAVETVLELIAQNSLYRGEEFKGMLTEFLKFQKEYVGATNKDTYCWATSAVLPPSISKIRNSAIGTLLTDISEGKELDYAVAAFEKMVAPQNYKRPTALVTKGMIEEAEKMVTSLGLVNSLGRRFATVNDITVNNVLFVNRDSKAALGMFDALKEDLPVNPKQFGKIEEISIDTFMKDVLPTVKSLEVLFENGHLNNLMTVITAKDITAPPLFKWGNPFSWSYSNAVTDSLREKVVSAGGRVDGVFRFTHSWNELEKNQSLMDLHVFMPGNKHFDVAKPHDGYGVGRRVGWNQRQDPQSGGVQDVDFTAAAPDGYIPVENITFPTISKMPEGVYICKIHNWSFRGTGGKGKAEIEFDGNLYQYEYPATKNKEWVTIAEVTLKDGKFSIEHKLPQTTSSKEKWGMSTNKFQKVSMVMNSPNHWDGDHGNKHYFFILDKAKTDETPRGFFNEFLTEDLLKNKRVFEVLGGKLKPEASDKELSGLGFSSTNRASVICKVEGKFERTIKINF